MYVMGKLGSVRFEILLVLAQDRCTVCAECTSAQKSFWAHPMVLLANVGQEEARFDPFRGRVSLGARYVHNLRPTYKRLGNHFGRNRWYFYVMWVRWKLVSICLEILLISAQDRCPVCAESTMAQEIDLGTPDGTPS